MLCLDAVSMRENGTVPFGTFLFGTEPFHASHVNAKQVQMVPEVTEMEVEFALSHKNPVLSSIWRVK